MQKAMIARGEPDRAGVIDREVRRLEGEGAINSHGMPPIADQTKESAIACERPKRAVPPATKPSDRALGGRGGQRHRLESISHKTGHPSRRANHDVARWLLGDGEDRRSGKPLLRTEHRDARPAQPGQARGCAGP